jgi:hypothetical protein
VTLETGEVTLETGEVTLEIVVSPIPTEELSGVADGASSWNLSTTKMSIY